jgi:hypothetical protein
LISRRPLGSGPGALPLFAAPSAKRNSSTVTWIDATLGPLAWNTAGFSAVRAAPVLRAHLAQ